MRNRMIRIAAALTAVLVVPAVASAQAASHAAKAPTKNIVQVATDAGSFTTLVAAVKAAGLEQTLRDAGPFTVFAPTDAAFAKLPAGTVDALLADRAKLASILTYHVVSGRVTAADLVKSNGAMPATVNGQPLDIAVRGGKVYVNGVSVVTADVQASNGVVHVIDAVLLPP
ncbi:MAG TPA: fasciclin domain-containing protein, partial [Gemmatimonadaceae bacterium]|nr:fasciclin domain-containing protein [Gemmatimonadaceae bacterium]